MSAEEYLKMVDNAIQPVIDEVKKEEAEKVAIIGSSFLELHTVNIGNPVLVNIDQIAVIGDTDDGTMITLSFTDVESAAHVEVRESYEAIKNILRFLFRR